MIPVKRACRRARYAVSMKPWQHDQLRRALEERRTLLLEELRRDAGRLREERFGELAGPVHDLGDESIAALLSDVGNAELSRDVEELREVEAARRRLAEGAYGICVDCGEAIPMARLKVHPFADRCIRCATALESRRR